MFKYKFTLPSSPKQISVTVVCLLAVAAYAIFWAVDTLNRHALFLPAEGVQPTVRVIVMAVVIAASVIIAVGGVYLLCSILNDKRKKIGP